MNVHVSQDFNGSLRHRLTFRVLNPNVKGRRVWAVEYVRGERWTRETAKDALDLLDCVYQFKRRNVRFLHF